MKKNSLNLLMRKYHRYLGFFLVGIMAVYAISGFVLIFRNTDFLKTEKIIEKKFPLDTKVDDIGKLIRIRDFKIENTKDGIVYFQQGTYDTKTGIVSYKAKELLPFFQKLTKLHKASTSDPLFFLNIFFAISLLFFVVSSFWMFLPKTEIFRKGVYVALAGIGLTLILIFFL